MSEGRFRRWQVIAGGCLLIFVLLAGLVHTPPVRAGVLSWALARFPASGLRADVERLDYNLLTLTVSLEAVTLSAEGSDTPFFSTDAVRLDLPWSNVRGTLGIQSLEIDRPRIAIVRENDGSLNLPETAGAEDADTEPIAPVQIDRLVVRELDARYADASVSLDVDGRGVTLDLAFVPGGRLSGRLSVSDGVTLQLGDHETRMTALEGGVAFDGAALFVDALTLEAPEARMRLDGTVSLLAADQRIDVRYEGRLDAERLAPWVGLDSIPRGQITFSGTAQGPLTAPGVTLDLASDGLAWSTLGNLALEARAEMTGPVARLESFRATLAGGEILGDAELRLDDEGSSRVRAQFADLDMGTLASLAPDLPVRIAAVAGGDVALEWAAQDVTTALGSVSTRLRASAAGAGALGLAGRLDLELGRGTWKLSFDQRISEAVVLRGDADGRRVRDDLAASTLRGRASLDIGSLPDALRRFRAAGLDIDEEIAERVRGTVSANLDLGGTLDEPRATGSLDANELWLDDAGPGTAHAGLDATRGAVTLDPLRLDIGPNAVSGSVAIGLEAHTLSGMVTAALPELTSLAIGLPAAWRPDGSAEFDARLGGTLDNPAVRLALSARDLRVAGQTFRTVQSNVELADRIVTVDELELIQDVGRLTATGHYEIAGGRYAFDAAGDAFSVSPLMLGPGANTTNDAAESVTIPLDARFDLRISGDGTIASPSARGFAQFSHLDWSGYQLGAARADAVLENGSARIEAAVSSVSATLQASIGLEAPRPFTVAAAALDTNLSALLSPSGPASTIAPGEQFTIDPADVAGALSVRAYGTGELDDLAGATVDLDLRLLDVAIAGAPVRLERPARLHYAGNELTADDFELHVGDSTLSASGRLGSTSGAGEDLVVALTGSFADFGPFIRLVPAAEAFDVTGAIDLRVRASGSLEAPDIESEFSLGAASFTRGSLPPISDVAIRGTYTGGLLEVSELRGSWQGATLTASGRVPAVLLRDVLPERYLQSLPAHEGMARATARITSISEDTLAPFAQETVDAIAGRFDAVIEVEATSLDPDAVRADVTLDRAVMALARVPVIQRSPTRLRLAGGSLDVLEWSWAGAGSRLDVEGGAIVTGEMPRLDLAVTGEMDLRMLGAFAPEVATAGRALFQVSVAGPVNDPLVAGQITVTDADIIIREPRFAIADLSGLVNLSRERIELRDVTASANGGTLQMTGDMEYRDFELTGGAVTLTGRGLAFEIPENLRTEANADLELSLSPTAPSLTGRVTILQGSYREPLSLAGQLLTGVTVAAGVPVETEPGFVDRIQLGLSIVSDQDILVDNNYGRLDLGSNLKVIGTLGQPVLAGRLTLQEGGEVFLGGRSYLVRQGTVDFTNATQIEPDMNLVLETRVQRYDVTLDVSGTPQTLQASLRSPGLSQEDVVSLLLTGRLAGESSAAQTEIARGQLLMLLSGELLGFAGRAVGVDSLQVGRGLGGAASDFDLLATNTDPSARLTVAKDLRRDVEVVFSQSLRESGDITWIAIYRPLRNIELRGTTEDDKQPRVRIPARAELRRRRTPLAE